MEIPESVVPISQNVQRLKNEVANSFSEYRQEQIFNLDCANNFLGQKMSSQGKQEQEQQPKSFSCASCFDALYFCYSPVYQMKQYYREGTLDDCYSKWSDLFDCFKLKTMKSSQVQAVLEEREKAKLKDHIWEFRTPEEAAKHWNEQFGD